MTKKQIDNGGSVTADLICQRHVAENVIEEEKVQSVGGLSVRDYFAAAAVTGIYSNSECGANVEEIAILAYLQADSMLAERKGGA